MLMKLKGVSNWAVGVSLARANGLLVVLAVGPVGTVAPPVGRGCGHVFAVLGVPCLALVPFGGPILGSLGFHGGAARLGFGPVLSLTVCLTLAIHALDGRFITVALVRRVLACLGVAAVVLEGLFPGEARALGSAWAPLHWLLGVASYGLLGSAVLHGLLLDAAERRLRQRKGLAPVVSGMPLLQIERITFRFVEAGFAVLSAAITLGIVTSIDWRWDHKTVLSLLGWAIFALLLAGRYGRGWRGRQATRWLYAGALVLLLAYVGSRFVLEVLLSRTAA